MNLVIFHFGPLEEYPPIINFLTVLSETKGEFRKILVITTKKANKNLISFNDPRIKVLRIAEFTLGLNLISRLKSYIFFYFVSLLKIFAFRPQGLIYFESISSFGPFLLKRIFYRKIPVFIHYHEYMTAIEYKNGMLLNKYFNSLEKYLFKRAVSITHTNKFRLSLFHNDFPFIKSSVLGIMPNYPPKKWGVQNNGYKNESEVKKIVYVGAFDLKNFYILEFITWVEQQKGRIKFDIFSQKDSEELEKYLSLNNIKHSKYKGFVPYNELPSVISKYDIGVVLYKSYSENAIYNAPNKLFEYFNCGLDVWFPHEQVGSRDYVRSHVYPKILALDFSAIYEWNIDDMISRKGLDYEPSVFYCEDIYIKYFDKILLSYKQSI